MVDLRHRDSTSATMASACRRACTREGASSRAREASVASSPCSRAVRMGVLAAARSCRVRPEMGGGEPEA